MQSEKAKVDPKKREKSDFILYFPSFVLILHLNIKIIFYADKMSSFGPCARTGKEIRQQARVYLSRFWQQDMAIRFME